MNTLLQGCVAAALLGFASQVLASPTIELKDGSRIQGDIQSIQDGAYTILSPSLGTVHVPQANIVRIVYSGDAALPAAPVVAAPMQGPALASEIQQAQARLVQDPAAMRSIMSLQSDPQIQAVLSDPAIAKAIQDGDYASLLGNAKIQALENNEQVRQLLQKTNWSGAAARCVRAS